MITEVEGIIELNGNEYFIKVNKNEKKITLYYDEQLEELVDSSNFDSAKSNTGKITRVDDVLCILNICQLPSEEGMICGLTGDSRNTIDICGSNLNCVCTQKDPLQENVCKSRIHKCTIYNNLENDDKFSNILLDWYHNTLLETFKEKISSLNISNLKKIFLNYNKEYLEENDKEDLKHFYSIATNQSIYFGLNMYALCKKYKLINNSIDFSSTKFTLKKYTNIELNKISIGSTFKGMLLYETKDQACNAYNNLEKLNISTEITEINYLDAKFIYGEYNDYKTIYVSNQFPIFENNQSINNSMSLVNELSYFYFETKEIEGKTLPLPKENKVDGNKFIFKDYDSNKSFFDKIKIGNMIRIGYSTNSIDNPFKYSENSTEDKSLYSKVEKTEIDILNNKFKITLNKDHCVFWFKKVLDKTLIGNDNDENSVDYNENPVDYLADTYDENYENLKFKLLLELFQNMIIVIYLIITSCLKMDLLRSKMKNTLESNIENDRINASR